MLVKIDSDSYALVSPVNSFDTRVSSIRIVMTCKRVYDEPTPIIIMSARKNQHDNRSGSVWMIFVVFRSQYLKNNV